jgi:hypothetical protein
MLAPAADIVFIIVAVAAVTVAAVTVAITVVALAFVLLCHVILLLRWLVVASCLPLLLASLPRVPL